MIMLGTYKLLGVFVLFLLDLVLVCAQDQSGFISIDCGRPGNSSYKEEITGLIYVSDANFIDTGESKSISSENKNKYKEHYSFVRTFPKGSRNCYKINNIANGTKYLIRASFVYGNYDGLDTYPEFDLHIGANFWDTVNWENEYTDQQKEIIHVPLQSYIHICLVKNSGNPFVSSIELRPLSPSYYKTQTPVSLSLINRLDIGPSKGSYRYPEDVHDRLWVAFCDEDWTNINTSSTIEFDSETYRLPSDVMTTAATPKSANGSLEYRLPTDNTSTNALYYVYMHFAEVEELQANQSREFSIFYDGELYYKAESPTYLQASTIRSTRGIVGGQSFVISKTANSTLPPILNAIEVYVVREFFQSETHEGDADAITKIKSTYSVERNWQGDPCTRDYLWEGLNCSYVGYDPPRIINLNLSSSGLTGEIPLAISNLTMLEVLDLSLNNFTGPVPEFLSQLPKLRVLNLEGNNLNGSLPVKLIQKSEDGSLNLSVDQNPNLCISVSCNKKKKKKNVVVPVVASVVGISVLLLLVTTICWFLKRKRQHSAAEVENEKSITQHGSFESTNRQFTWSEIQKITNNFERILGDGGFGTVYHGYIDGTQVAVKMLSPSSVQGYQQFHAEVNLLMRVHHRNLTNLVGYCNDGTNTGLIYEYMANGNLQTHISDGSSRILKWEDRLRIAIEAAQGLEYLHDGCKPPIVHRDVKCTNILLNENFQAKLSDLGLSKMFPTDNKTHISTVVAGTPGYLDPEYYITNWLNEKSDVYSYGVVLLEIISSRPAIAKTSEKTHISSWASSMLAKGDITSIVDKRLQGSFDTNSVWRAVEIAMACVSKTSTKRPTMNQVVAGLKECLAAERGRGWQSHETIDSIELVSLNMMSEYRPLAR